MAHTIAVRVAFSLATVLGAVSFGEAKSRWGAPLERDRKEGAKPCDWTEFYARADREGLRLAYRCAETIDFTRGAAYCVYLDTDGKRGTGYRGGADNFPIGADFLLQGGTLHRYTGDGIAWSWTIDGETAYALDSDWAEFTISPALLPLARDELRVFLLGDNTAEGVGGTGNDEMPDGALRKGGGGKFFRIKIR